MWLGKNTEAEDRVLFDFLRYNGTYLNASRQQLGQPMDDFDYTTFYTRVPNIDRSRFAMDNLDDSEIPAITEDLGKSALMAEEAAAYMDQYDPRLFVTPTDALAETFKPTDPRLLAPVQWQASGENASDRGLVCCSAVELNCTGVLSSTGGDPVETRHVRLVYSNPLIMILEMADSPSGS